MVDLSNYTINIEECDNGDYIATVKEYPNIKVIEDSYKASYHGLKEAINKAVPNYAEYWDSSLQAADSRLVEAEAYIDHRHAGRMRMLKELFPNITIDQDRYNRINKQYRDTMDSVNGTSQEEKYE